MNEEVNKIINNLEGCIGMFDYLLTPVESNSLVSYIKNLEHNWNELKKWLEEKLNNNKGSIDGKLTTGEYIELQLVWFKMQELEEVSNE